MNNKLKGMQKLMGYVEDILSLENEKRKIGTMLGCSDLGDEIEI